jgi:hypothetical protein
MKCYNNDSDQNTITNMHRCWYCTLIGQPNRDEIARISFQQDGPIIYAAFAAMELLVK